MQLAHASGPLSEHVVTPPAVTSAGARQAADAALLTGAAEIIWINGWSIAGTFEGEFSNVTRSYAGKGVVRYAW